MFRLSKCEHSPLSLVLYFHYFQVFPGCSTYYSHIHNIRFEFLQGDDPLLPQHKFGTLKNLQSKELSQHKLIIGKPHHDLHLITYFQNQTMGNPPFSPAALQEEGVMDDDLDAKPQGDHAFPATCNTNTTYRTHQNGERPVMKIIEASRRDMWYSLIECRRRGNLQETCHSVHPIYFGRGIPVIGLQLIETFTPLPRKFIE